MLFEGLLCSEATHLPLTQQGPQSHSRGTRHAFLCRYGNLSYFANPTAATASLQAYLQGSYNSYQRNVWLTEWCLADFGNATNNYAFTFATYAQQVTSPASATYLGQHACPVLTASLA